MDDPVRDQALVDDALGQRRHGHALLLALLADPLLALDDFHEILGRLDLEHLALVVADHCGFQAALVAHALVGSTSDDLFHAGQVGRKCLPAGVRAPLPLLLIRLRQRFPLALGLNFFAGEARLFFQQLQLQAAQLLAARSVPGDAAQAQMLFQHLDLQPGVL